MRKQTKMHAVFRVAATTTDEQLKATEINENQHCLSFVVVVTSACSCGGCGSSNRPSMRNISRLAMAAPLRLARSCGERQQQLTTTHEHIRTDALQSHDGTVEEQLVHINITSSSRITSKPSPVALDLHDQSLISNLPRYLAPVPTKTLIHHNRHPSPHRQERIPSISVAISQCLSSEVVIDTKDPANLAFDQVPHTSCRSTEP